MRIDKTADFGVEQVEDRLKQAPPALLRKVVDASDTTLAPSVSPDATITFHATVESPGASTGVVKVGTWKAADLYGYSEAPFVSYHFAIAEITALLKSLVHGSSDELDFELQSVTALNRLSDLGRYMGISTSHDELIVSLQQVALAHVDRPLIRSHAMALHLGLQRLSQAFRLTEDLVDELLLELEKSGLTIVGTYLGPEES